MSIETNARKHLDEMSEATNELLYAMQERGSVPDEEMELIRDMAMSLLTVITTQHDTVDRMRTSIKYALGDRPSIVVLCGSTRFAETFNEEAERLTLEGHIVLRPEVVTYSSDKDPQLHSPETKEALDELHLRKIDLCISAHDAIHVINVDGYVGESTLNEIMYAHARDVNITFYQPEFEFDPDVVLSTLQKKE